MEPGTVHTMVWEQWVILLLIMILVFIILVCVTESIRGWNDQYLSWNDKYLSKKDRKRHIKTINYIYIIENTIKKQWILMDIELHGRDLAGEEEALTEKKLSYGIDWGIREKNE